MAVAVMVFPSFEITRLVWTTTLLPFFCVDSVVLASMRFTMIESEDFVVPVGLGRSVLEGREGIRDQDRLCIDHGGQYRLKVRGGQPWQ